MGNSPVKKRPKKAGFQKIDPPKLRASIVPIDSDEDDDSGKGNSPKRESDRKSASLSNHSDREMSLAEMKMMVNELTRKNKRLNREQQDIEGELRLKREEITVLRNNKEDAAKKISELQLELGVFLQDCKSEVQQLEERLKQKHEDELSESKTQLEELIKNNEKQSEELEELKNKCQELENRLSEQQVDDNVASEDAESTINTNTNTNVNNNANIIARHPPKPHVRKPNKVSNARPAAQWKI